MEPPKKKMKISSQTFKDTYTEEWPCLIKSRLSDHHAFCTVCCTDFSVRHSGRFDCKTHVSGAKHKKFMQSKQTNTIASMFKSSTSSDPESPVTKAEALMCEFIAKHNLSLSVADELPTLIKNMCTDSKIAKDIRCARSKTTAIINEMSTCVKENLIARMKTGPFTVSTDGSNDMGSTKLFPLVVRTIGNDGVHSELVSVPACDGSGTGEKIFTLIDGFFKENGVPWSNCISLGCDNANVMTGLNKGVYAFCKGKHPELYLSGCPLHLVHIAAEKAAQSLPVNISDVLIDIYYYFHKSSVRSCNFSKFQDLYGKDQLKMLKHCSTRWMSIGRCVVRLLDNWDPLKKFFKEELIKKDTSAYAKKKVTKILEFLQSRSAHLYCLFLNYTIKVFDKYLTNNQSAAPKISSIMSDSRQLVRALMTRFCCPSAFGGNKPAPDVEYWLPYHQRNDKDLVIGEECQIFIANKNKNGLSDARITEFYANIRKYFCTAVEYLIKALPLNDPFLSRLAIADPANTSACGNDVRALAERFPVLVPDGISMDTLIEEYANYQCCAPVGLNSDRLDQYWVTIGQIQENGSFVYGAIAKFMLGLLTIPHSSAHCERVFSCVRKIKTDERSSLGGKTLESLLVLKHKQSSTYDVNSLPPEGYKRLKKAYANSLSKE